MTYLLALDQGTSSSRSIIFDIYGNIIGIAQQELTQYYPQTGWVEHNAMEIWQSQFATIAQVFQNTRIQAKQIAALGITNQRETTIVWNRATGVPIYNAIVWQDRRTSEYCDQLRAQHSDVILSKTGLLIDPYFSATKLKWILDNVPQAREQASRGELAFGTVDTWLAWQLSEKQLHVTDVTNASRTMLWNIHTHNWDEDLLELFNIPFSLLPKVHLSSHQFGKTHLFDSPITIGGIAGDQQSALFGQACTKPGMAKNTYGTGCFLLMNTGAECAASSHGLLSTVACKITTASPQQYALEGSVFIGGAVVQWLRDGLGIIENSKQIEELANSVQDSDGVIFVPALTGLGAPYWDANAKGAIFGLTRRTTHAHIARAAIEAIAYQTSILLIAMNKDSPAPLRELRVDGGASMNNYLLQFQADLLGIPVIRPKIIETTALGVAYLAGISVGVFENIEACESHWQEDRRFEPKMSREQAKQCLFEWGKAVERLL
jgi:glycerol kinase